MPARRSRSGGPRAPAPLGRVLPEKRWRAITLATLLLVPAYWFLLAGLVAIERGAPEEAPDPRAAFALGLAVVPFVYVVLAFMSQHPRAAGAVWRAMGLSVVVGIPVSAVAADAVTGLVAGIGSGGIVALRREEDHSIRSRAIAVAAGSGLVFVLIRLAGAAALLPAPILTFTGIGIADHLAERAHEQSKTPPTDHSGRGS